MMLDYKKVRLDREKQMLDEYAKSFEEFYLNDEIIDEPNRSTPLHDGFISDGMDEASVTYLQDILDIAKIVDCDDQLIFHTLLKSHDKPNFTKYLLSKTQLKIPVNDLDEEENTVFMLLADKTMDLDKNYPIHMVSSLIKNGYKTTDEDIEFVKDLYKSKNTKQNPKKQKRWSHLRLLTLLKDVERYDVVTYYGNLNAYFAIISFKINKVFGTGHDNLLAMANNALSNYKTHIDVILHALEFYNREQAIIDSDKKGTFARKKQECLDNPVEQDEGFAQVVFTILPELKDTYLKTA